MPEAPIELTPAVVARLQDLLALPLDQALYHLARESHPFRVAALAWLLRHCLLLGPERTGEIWAAASLALALAEQFPLRGLSFEGVSDQRALARALLAEVRVRRLELEVADLELREAERHLARGAGNAVSRGYVQLVRGMIARADRQADKALAQFSSAADLFRRGGESDLAAAADVRRGLILFNLGDRPRARPLLLTSLIEIDPARFRLLTFQALGVLVRIFRGTR